MVCKKCGTAVLDDGATYCSACGSRLDGKKACISCGKLNDVDFTYCVYCGERMDGKTVCSACGTAYNGQFCHSCGKSEGKQEQVTARTRIKEEEESVCGKGKICKVFDIVSGGFLMAGVLFALIFVFLISLTAEVAPMSVIGRLGVSENVSIFDYFGKYYKDLGELGAGYTWFEKLLYNNQLNFGIIATGLVVVTLSAVVGFAITATVIYVRNWMGLTKRKADKWALATIFSFLAGVIAFFGLHKVALNYTEEEVYKLSLITTSATNWGLVLSAIALIGGGACKIVAGGKENLRARKIVGFSLSLVSIVFCCLLFVFIGNYATDLGLRMGEGLINIKSGNMYSNELAISIFGALGSSLKGELYRDLTLYLETFIVLSTAIQVLLLATLLAIIVCTIENFKNFFENKKTSGLAMAIVTAAFALGCLILHIVANGCLNTLLEIVEAEENGVKVIASFVSPICLFVFSILNWVVACVHSALNSKWKKCRQAE